MLENISISNRNIWIYSKNTDKKYHSFDKNKVTTVSNKTFIIMISEGSYDTEDWHNGVYILKHIQIYIYKKKTFTFKILLLIFHNNTFCIFNQINLIKKIL